MNFSLKKYQKSSLALVSIALLSVSSYAQSQVTDYTQSYILLCEMDAGWGTGSGVREDLKDQAYVSVSTILASYGLPRNITTYATIFDRITYQMEHETESVSKDTSVFYAESSITARFIESQPSNKWLWGLVLISGPGIQYRVERDADIEDIPTNANGRPNSCLIEHDPFI